MKPFDPKSTCPKCLCDSVGATHWPANEPLVNYKPERIARTCQRCGYAWDELPVDSVKVSAQTAKPEVTRLWYGRGGLCFPDRAGEVVGASRTSYADATGYLLSCESEQFGTADWHKANGYRLVAIVDASKFKRPDGGGYLFNQRVTSEQFVMTNLVADRGTLISEVYERWDRESGPVVCKTLDGALALDWRKLMGDK